MVPSPTRFFFCEIWCWEKKKSHNSAIEVSSLIESNQTQQHILKKRGKQLPLDVNHGDSDVLVTAGILIRIPDQPLSTTVMVCGWKNNWFWFAIIQLTLLFKPLLHVFLAGKQGKRPGDCCLHTLSVCFSAKYVLENHSSRRAVNGSFLITSLAFLTSLSVRG